MAEKLSRLWVFGVATVIAIFSSSSLIVNAVAPQDNTPPSAITNLFVSGETHNSVTLTWTVPGDDGSTGTASGYDIRFSLSEILSDADFNAANKVMVEPFPALSGTTQSAIVSTGLAQPGLDSITINSISQSRLYFFAMKTADEVPNFSPISNVVSTTTPLFSGSPVIPHAFYGNMTLNGNPAPIGTVLISQAENGAERGYTIIKQAGSYGGSGAFDGKLIVNEVLGNNQIIFRAYDPVADTAFSTPQTAVFESGEVTNLNLTFGISQITPVSIPTDGRPSPLFGAESFEQKLILFEEFGAEPYDPNEPPEPNSLPQPLGARNGPEPAALEAFLDQPGFSLYNPVRMVNYSDPNSGRNPWESKIEEYLGLTLDTAPAEGRPPGEQWAHQKWKEFYPQKYFTTAQAGARVNGGFRDDRQRHGYSVGEFGEGGLYNVVYTSSVQGAPTLSGTTSGLPIKIHPNMPVQGPDAVWTFDGTLPPKLLMARNGEAVLMRHYNTLPIDETANRGFGIHTITTHEHNGHSPGESDGFAGAFFYPGQYYDYRWPLQLAGYDTINTNATDPRAALPCEPGERIPVDDDNDGIPTLKTCENGSIKIRGDWRETMSTHWFHDHMLDHTAENVYKGNAVMMNYYSALDRGNEAFDDGINLRFPSGTALSWGNRDYDINILVADKAWDQEGQLWFSHNSEGGHDGFIGDRVLTNWLYHPYLDVRSRSYRFRILNGAVSRIFALALVQQVQGDTGEIAGSTGSGVSYNRVPFHLIANDGNVMEHTVPFDGSIDLDSDGELLDHKGQLPSQGIAERYDIIVDFSKHGISPGDKLYFVNVMEHEDGKGSKGKVPLEQILSEQYKAEVINGTWANGDPAVGKFLELRVHEYAGQDLSMDPADYEPGKLTMIPLPIDRNDPSLATAPQHTFEFVRSDGGSETPWKIRVDGGDKFPMDPHRISALMSGGMEIWNIEGNNEWTHPVHIHFEEGVILERGGKAPPEWEMWARKDLYRVGPEEDSNDTVKVAIRARDFVGTFVEHCHNTMHEDHAMLMRWDALHPDQTELGLTPMPTWDGVKFHGAIKLDPADHPVITILGDNPAEVVQNNAYIDAGAVAFDETDRDLTAGIITTSNVDTAAIGVYDVTYRVNDAAGNIDTAARKVKVILPDDDDDGVPNANDSIKGNIGDVRSNFNIIFEIEDDSGNVLMNPSSHHGHGRLRFKDASNFTHVEFEYEFSNSSVLDLSKIRVIRDENNETGSIVVSGIDLASQGMTKTVFISNNKGTANVCVKDAEVLSVNNVSNGCNAAGEMVVKCDGSNQNGKVCTQVSNTRYQVSGLSHSAVKEFVAPAPIPSVPGGGGGSGTGGSGASGSSQQVPANTAKAAATTTTTLAPAAIPEIVDESKPIEVPVERSVDAVAPQEAAITGAATTQPSVQPLFALLLVGAIVAGAFGLKRLNPLLRLK